MNFAFFSIFSFGTGRNHSSSSDVRFGAEPETGAVVATRKLSGYQIRSLNMARILARHLIQSPAADWLIWVLTKIDVRRGLHLRGHLYLIRRGHDDEFEFWNSAAARFPSDPIITRCTIHAALRAGRFEAADAGFRMLIQAKMTGASDCPFVIGLTLGDQQRGDHARIRARIRAFLASLRGKKDYRIAAVRLSRLIYAYFSRAGVRRTGRTSRRARLHAMIEHSPVRDRPKQLLTRVCACEEELRRASSSCWVETDVSRPECGFFVALVRERLAEGQPFSFIRIGDGEAACLPYEARLRFLARADARRRERIWWGASLDDDARNLLAPKIARAMWDSDCIGIPTAARFLREIQLSRNDYLELSLTGRGLRSILYCTERWREMRSVGLPDPIFTSAHLHQDLWLWDCYGELFDGAGEVVLISCHPGLAECLEQKFHVQVAAHILVPPDRISGSFLRQRPAQASRLPELLDEAAERMADLPRNRLVLVGAGYPGKLLTDIAKKRGGVALDLGSIFDYWLGYNTRSYLDLNAV